jgi:hypothetical protein
MALAVPSLAKPVLALKPEESLNNQTMGQTKANRTKPRLSFQVYPWASFSVPCNYTHNKNGLTFKLKTHRLSPISFHALGLNPAESRQYLKILIKKGFYLLTRLFN